MCVSAKSPADPKHAEIQTIHRCFLVATHIDHDELEVGPVCDAAPVCQLLFRVVIHIKRIRGHQVSQIPEAARTQQHMAFHYLLKVRQG